MDTVVKGDGKVSPSAAGKKLKQTRLPFQILTGSPATSPLAAKTTPTRKRKPSIEVDSNRATKIGRTSEAKENVKDSVAPVVVLDDDAATATESPVVLVVDDDLSSTSAKEDGETSGESAGKEKDDKIKIKFPIGKKKGRKSSAGEEGSAKKKVSKEKKKHRKESKKSKVEETKAADESIVLDDSELSDAEKEDEKEEVKVVETPVNEEKEDDSDPAVIVVADKDEDVPSEQADKKDQTVENVEKVETTEDASSKPVTAATEGTKQPEPVIEVDPAEDPSNDVKKKAENEAVTPRRTRLPRVASQKASEPEEPKTDQVTPKRGRSAKKSAEDKKSESTTPKAQTKSKDAGESELGEKTDSAEIKPKPAGGALDKLFAKIQTESKAKPSNESETNELQKTPEKKSPKAKETPTTEAMEVDQPEVAGTSKPITSAISVSICLDDSSDGAAGADDEENAYMLCTPNSKERSLLGDDKKDRKLTPKQLARRKEAEQRQAAKQQELEERKKKKEEEKEAKLREKEEQERLRKKEKEEKEEQKRKEREEKEEQKRKEKEEKEDQKRKEREEKERKRLAEVEAKNEEKRKKDEQKEEERKKKEEEKEAEEKRKQKTAQAFQSFFVKKPASKDMKQSDDENSMDRHSVGEGDVPPRLAFMPFCVKGDMRLAPVCRVLLEGDRKKRLEEEVLAGKIDSDSERGREGLYLQQLKHKNYVIGRSDRTRSAQDDEADDDDVMIVDENVCHQIEVDPSAAPSRRYRAKFFLFEENRRPPYRGTWRKSSSKIQPRRPFVQDTKFFDYEVDSDDEWEEEEPGESLHGSDDEKDVDPEEDYEVDNDFFVPHGHLSDEEMQAEDDIMDDNSPETQKAKLKIMQQEFAAEMKKKTEKIKPRLIGCLWENGPGEGPECSAVIWEILKARAMLFDPEEPISFTVQKSEPESNHTSPLKEKEPTERKPKQIKLVDEGVKELITLIHGCALNRKFLIKEFLAYWGKQRDEGEINVPQYAPDSVRTKILEVASWRPCPDEGPMQNKMCWYVNKEALVKYGLIDLKVPTGWEFILKPITKSKKEKKQKKDEEANGKDDGDKKADPKNESPKEKEKNERLQSTPSSATKPKPPDTATSSRITKFTKKLSEDDKRKQFAKEKKATATPAPSPSSSKSRKSKNAAPAAGASPSNADAKPVAAKKRVQLLMSVPRGQNINQTTKSNLISQFLAKTAGNSSSDSSSSNGRNNLEAMEVDPPAGVIGGDNGDETVIVLDD